MTKRIPAYPTSDRFEQDHDDERTARRRERQKTKGVAGGGAKRKPPAKGLILGADCPIQFEIIALSDDYSINPRLHPDRFFAHPHFAKERSKQRAIRDWMTDACLTWGDQTRAPEATHFTITDACIARAIREKFDISEARGLRLVLTGRDRNVIKTGYWVTTPSRFCAA